MTQHCGHWSSRCCIAGAALVLLVAACGGGSGSPDAAPPTTPPTITAQPQAQAVVEGQLATWAVAARGAGALAYQWQRNGIDIGGATGPVYATPPLAPAAKAAFAFNAS